MHSASFDRSIGRCEPATKQESGANLEPPRPAAMFYHPNGGAAPGEFNVILNVIRWLVGGKANGIIRNGQNSFKIHQPPPNIDVFWLVTLACLSVCMAGLLAGWLVGCLPKGPPILVAADFRGRRDKPQRGRPRQWSETGLW